LEGAWGIGDNSRRAIDKLACRDMRQQKHLMRNSAFKQNERKVEPHWSSKEPE